MIEVRNIERIENIGNERVFIGIKGMWIKLYIWS